MVKFVSLEDYHHFMIDKPECENGAEIKETILDDNLLQNVLYLTNCDMRIMLNVLEKYLIENIDKRRDNEFITGELVLGLDYEIILIICSTIRGMDEEEYIDKILKPKNTTNHKTIIASVPDEFWETFGGFSIAGDLKKYFPDNDDDRFYIFTTDNLKYKAHRSQSGRVKIYGGKKCFERLGVRPLDKLKIEILEPLKSYKIIDIIRE